MAGSRIAVAVMALAIAAPAAPQSLGELARQEEARRASSRKSVKTFSNSDLKPGEIAERVASLPPPGGTSVAAPAAVSADCYVSVRLGRCASVDEIYANSVEGKLTRVDAVLEQQWRRDAELLRAEVEQSQRSVAALERTIEDARTENDRNAATQALRSARRALAGVERKWVKFERLAANQRIPAAWIEPVPILSPAAREQ